MVLQETIPLKDVVLMLDRNKFCEERCGTEEKCFFCNGLDLKDVEYWISDSAKERYLYLLKEEKKRNPRKCIWCEKSFGKGEIKTHVLCHSATYQQLLLNTIQRKLYAELLRVRRTGRWWAEAFTFWRCPLCIKVDGVCKPLRNKGVTNKDRLGCIYGLGLDLQLPVDWENWGVVIV